MKLFGLTGGIASGKSSVSRILTELGIPVICLDTLNREAAAQPAMQEAILSKFGTLDRQELRKIVFANQETKTEMENLMYPSVLRLFKSKIAELKLKRTPIAFYDSALIFEMKQEKMFTAVVVVDCPMEIRKARTNKRDGTDQAVIDKIMSYQVQDFHRRMAADYLIVNDGTLEQLKEQVLLLLRNISYSDLP